MPHRSWQTVLTNGIVVSGMLLGWTNGAIGQVRPIADDTLGNERSIVVPLGGGTSGDRIDGGARRGDNLFHSFQEFGVDAGRSVYFSDPGVSNIITRVTGGNSSQIDGVLGVLGNANLFLINPSGIIFGANAQLDLAGSFTATTADAIVFNNQGNFSATNPTAPQLLTVQPSAFFFNHLNPAPIVNNSFASTQANPSGYPEFGLRVPEGESLTLLGGNISMVGGGLNALGGKVEIGGLSAPGTVSRNTDGSLSFPTGIARADVSLTNGSFIDVAANGGGSITANADNFELLGSYLLAGIGGDSGFVGVQAGDITLNANAIDGGDGAIIRNVVDFDSSGNAGDIRITTGTFSLTNGAELQAGSFGQGNAGNVVITAQERVALDNSYIFSNIGEVDSDALAVGNRGDISITTTGSLSLTNNAQLSTSTSGQSNAGNVIINAQGRVSVNNIYISTNVGENNSGEIAVGNSGSILINTADSFFLTNGSQLQTSIVGLGIRSYAGNVIINAQESATLDNSYILSEVDFVTEGNAGDIEIRTSLLSLTNGTLLTASTWGQGDAGNVILDARDRATLDNSYIFSSVNSDAEGNGGDIRITTGGFLSLTNGTQLTASTWGQGDAGDVIINTLDRVTFDNSYISSDVNSDAEGNGGDIQIKTPALSLTNYSTLTASTGGQGDAGNVILDARERVSLEAASSVNASTSSTSAGHGGTIQIVTEQLEVSDDAAIAVNSQGSGIAGNIDTKSQAKL